MSMLLLLVFGGLCGMVVIGGAVAAVLIAQNKRRDRD